MRKLSVFLLLPLLSLPLRVRAGRMARIGEAAPRDPARGEIPPYFRAFVRRCLRAPRRLLTHSATVQEIHVIAGAADADVIQATPPARRAGVRSLRQRVLPAAPRVRPQTT
jgi:hypothetical protein